MSMPFCLRQRDCFFGNGHYVGGKINRTTQTKSHFYTVPVRSLLTPFLTGQHDPLLENKINFMGYTSILL